MSKVRMLRQATMQEMVGSIGDNLDDYRCGSFDRVSDDASSYFEVDVVANLDVLGQVACTNRDLREIENCVLVHTAFDALPRSLARDPRMWAYYTHTALLQYSRDRWPIPADDNAAVKHIRTHFFADGARSIERDNAASRLWWMTSLCSGLESISVNDALVVLLHKSDVRANIIERPTVSQSGTVRSLVLKKLRQSYDGDKKLFERENFRALMKQINVKGGVMMLDVVDDLDQVIT